MPTPTPTPHPFSPLNPLLTRTDLTTALTTGFLDPLSPRTSPHGARIKLGHTGTHYDETAAQLEGFARPLWGLASLLAGGGSYPGAERWVRGLAAGTDPRRVGEYWGETRDRDQRMVEMSPIGFALAMGGSEGALWGGLTGEERGRVAGWLGGVNVREMPDTNWLWFRVFANLGLAKVGAAHDRARMLKDLDHLDTFYLGDGWSRDGPEGVRQLDYYSGSFAIQYAQLVYAALAGDEDPERAAEYKRRAARFAGDFVHYFDEDGAAIPFGRSTTYRMAMAAFWAALAFAFTPTDMATLLPPYLSDPGVIKGLLLRNLRWWASHHTSIFQADGTLSIGYVYPNQHFTENYNSPGSPYWGMKAFLVLALPETHPFWGAAEMPHPFAMWVGQGGVTTVHPITHPLHIMVRAKHHTYLLSTGQACHYPLKATQAKYGKFSYSARFGFCVPTGGYMLEQHALDGMIGFSDDGGETWKARRVVEGARIEVFGYAGEAGWPVLVGTWDVFGDGEVRCETWLVPPNPRAGKGKEHWYVRVHRLQIAPHSRHERAGTLLSAEGSWAVYGQGRDERILEFTDAASASDHETFEGRSMPTDHGCVGAYAVSAGGGAVGIKDLLAARAPGEGGGRAAEVLSVDANASLVWPRTVLPTLRGVHGVGERWFVTGVFGRGVVGGWKGEWDAVGAGSWEYMIPGELRERIVV